MKSYGDEDWIDLIREEEEEAQKKEKKDITKGYVWVGDEKLVFQEFKVSRWGFTMILPKSFETMTEEEDNTGRLSNRPEYILTDLEDQVNLTFSQISDPMADSEVMEGRDAVREEVQRMQPSIQVVESNELKVQNHTVAYFDFISSVDEKIHSLVFLFSLRGNCLMGSFNCLQIVWKDWKEVFLQMLNSIRFIK